MLEYLHCGAQKDWIAIRPAEEMPPSFLGCHTNVELYVRIENFKSKKKKKVGATRNTIK